MSWKLRSIEKRIVELENKLGINKSCTTSEYWKELNYYAGKLFMKSNCDTTRTRSFSLPEHLAFAKKIFYRLVEFYTRLYEKLLESSKEKLEGDSGDTKKRLGNYGSVLNRDYNSLRVAVIIEQLPLLQELKDYLLGYITQGASFHLYRMKQYGHLDSIVI